MQSHKTQFLDLALELGALRFGEFELKSGRISPYFFNAGQLSTGRAAARLGRSYAAALADAGLRFDMLFGPAYKGISLVALTAAALAEHHGLDCPYAYNRKEAKDHGEGGASVGAAIAGRVIIVDDVITAGTAVTEAVQIIEAGGGIVGGVLVAVDRQEVATGSSRSAVRELADRLGVPVLSIVSLEDLVTHMQAHPAFAQYLPAVRAYRERYGAK
ncbi:MAG: orotate phosphoribosyltransferase [Rhodospirillaceae bacterium]|nr:orotate phosphoribosyltransferase [Rhodospirillaceae bacterium]